MSAAAVWLLTGAIGCGSAGTAVQFVAGRVLLDGKPVENAIINFTPTESGGLVAYGKSDAAGLFRLTTARGGKSEAGAPVGDYTVTVTKWRNRLEELGPQPDPSDVEAAAKWQAEVDRRSGLQPDYIVPKAYGDKDTSPFKATVKKGRNTGPDFTFELSSDFKPGK